MILASYGDVLAKSFGRKVRNELESNERVSTRLPKDKTAAGNFETREGGGMITAGIGGPITGKGAHVCIVDDPIKNIEEALSPTIREKQIEWFNSTLYTRLEPGGTIIVLMTRWHQGDLAGYLLKEHSDDWEEIRLPAIAEENDPLGRQPGDALCPERYDRVALLGHDGRSGIRAAVGSTFWNALYQGQPVAQEGAIWKRNWWKRWSKIPDTFDQLIASWDAAVVEGGSSFNVGQIWGNVGANYYLIDQVRGKWGFSELVEKFTWLANKHPQAYGKLVENKANGPALQDTLQNKVPGIIMVDPRGGKLVRATAVAPLIEAGNVWIPENDVEYPWVTEFVNEAADFPNAKNDDQVDAASQALLHFQQAGTFTSASRDDPTEISRLRRGRNRK